MSMQQMRFFYDLLNQSSRALCIFLEKSRIPYEAVPISILKGEHLTGEYRDKVTRFKEVPAIIDYDFQLAGSVAIFRHLTRDHIVPEHWYPRHDFGRSRTDEYLEWHQRNLDLVSTEYFQQKWLTPYQRKDSLNTNIVNAAEKQLNHTLNEFERLFLKPKAFIVGNNVSYADLLAICEIDQSKYIGYNPFIHRPILHMWYTLVQKELGSYYKTVTDEFKHKLRTAEKQYNKTISST